MYCSSFPNRPLSWYELDGYDPRDDVEEPELSNSAIEHIRDHFQGVLNHLYGAVNTELSIEMLEFNLDEIAHHLKLKMPAHTPTVQRQKFV